MEIQSRKNEPIPEGWASDADGRMTTDASAGMKGCLMPLGGAENTSGYKGYGLAAMVEIFCGVLAGITITKSHKQYLVIVTIFTEQEPTTDPISVIG